MTSRTIWEGCDVRFQSALAVYHGGDLPKAERLARGIVEENPRYAGAHQLLALIAGQRGLHGQSAEHFLEAIKHDPGKVVYWLNCVVALCMSGQQERALEICKDAVVRFPGVAECHYRLGVVCSALGQSKEAVKAYTRAIELRPDYAEAHYNIGNQLYRLNDLEQALEHYRKSIIIRPDFAQAHTNQGNVLMRLGDLEEALNSHENALAISPAYADAHNNRGMVLYSLGRYQESLEAFDQAISCQPRLASAHNNQAKVLLDIGRYEDALRCCRRAIEVDQGHIAAIENYIACLGALGRSEEALLECDRLLREGSGSRQMYCIKAGIHLNGGEVEEALSCYEQALGPDDGVLDHAHHNRLFALNYSATLAQQDIFEKHREWGERLSMAAPGGMSSGLRAQANKCRERLRIGYVSPDFRRHSVSWFFEPLLHAHHRDAVDVYCYSNTRRVDNVTERIKEQADHWRDITTMSDVDVARHIQDDGIDVLVDMAGHTANNRLGVFAHRPAPVQLTWLGYPNTTGHPAIDYRLTDSVADPVGGADRWHSERLIRLEKGFLCYRPPIGAPDVAETPAMRAGYVTFGSFNRLPKINAKVIDVWSSILMAVPGSRLLMKDGAFQDARVRKNYLDAFSGRGIDASRLEFHQALDSLEEHLALYSRIDVALDPFPYNGTTTTLESLWMGVPVITFAGERHASRVGASLLTNIGLNQWIAESRSDYVGIAIQAAANIGGLAAVRSQLRNRLSDSSIFDVEGYAYRIERVYRTLYERVAR